MSLQAWRLSKRRYAADAFSGESPRLYPGRWNPIDVPMVYTSLSLSLAVLEVFVHMPKAAEPNDYVSVKADLPVDERSLERVDRDTLPPDWKRVDSPATREIGGTWARSLRSLVLLVPSVIIEGEWNALVNPAHPHAQKIQLTPPKLFQFDRRMFQPRP
jgi:RES domain-containing protein